MERASARSLFGRERELSELLAAFEDVCTGVRRFTLISGEAGIGKTRLLGEIASAATDQGAEVLWGRCWEGDGAPAFWSWRQILRTHVRRVGPEAIRARLGTAARFLSFVAPEVGELLGGESLSPESPEHSQPSFPIFDAVLRVLVAAAEAAPTVVLLDDLHWAEPSSLRLLEFVLNETEADRLQVVGSYREEQVARHPERTRLLGSLVRHGHQIALTGLPLEETAALTREGLGADLSDEMIARVHEATGGNPFFIHELATLLAVERPPATGSRLPPAVRTVVTRRIQPLSGAGRRMLETASVFGREFRLPPLEDVTVSPRAELVEYLEECAALGVVTGAASAVGGYRFAHSLVREALYEGLPPTRRLELHRQVGEALERFYGADVEAHIAEIAGHFVAAAALGRPDRAVDYATRAGDRAFAQFAYDDAVEHYRTALQVLDDLLPHDRQRRCDLLLTLAGVLTRNGDVDAASEASLAAADLARALDDPPRLARAAMAFAGEGVRIGDIDERRVRLLQEAFDALGDDEPLRALVLARLAMERYYETDREAREAQIHAALVAAREGGDIGILESTLSAAHFVLSGPQHVEERVALAEESLGIARDRGSAEGEMRARLWRVPNFLELGRVSEVDTEIENVERLAAELKSPRYQWLAAVMRADRMLMRGRLATAARLADDARALGERAEEHNAGVLRDRHRFVRNWMCGTLPQHLKLLEDLAEAFPDLRFVRTQLLLAYCQAGRMSEAQVQLDDLGSRDFADVPLDSNWLLVMAQVAEAAALLGDRRRAESLHSLLSPFSSQHICGRPAIYGGSISHYLGMLAAALGWHDEAVTRLDRAVAEHQRIGAPLCLVRSRLDRTRLALDSGEAAGSAELLAGLDEIVEEARRIGMEGVAERAEAMRAEQDGPEAVAVADGDVEPRHALRRDGDLWEVRFRGRAFHVRDSKGLRYLAELLRRPGQEVHVLDLVAASGTPNPRPTGARGTGDGLRPAGRGPGQAVLDGRARREYKRRIEELEADIGEAERFNDSERAARARDEFEFLTDELARASGLSGRGRRMADEAERARVNVTRVIRSAILKIGEHDPAAGRHLGVAVRTGMFCSYLPDPDDVPDWVI